MSIERVVRGAIFDRTHVNQKELGRIQKLGDEKGVDTPKADRLNSKFDSIDKNENGQVGRAEIRIAVRAAKVSTSA